MDTELVRFFVKVIQNGSFSRASERMKVPKSTVSKAITRLEHETGTKLLVRTTRSLTLTAAGKAFYDSCLGPIQAIEDAQKSLYGSDSILSGIVRITAPEDLGSMAIAPAVGELTRRHGQISFELSYSDEVLDLVKEGFDIAIRVGKLKASALRAKKIGEVVLVAVASPAYLKSQPKIQVPQDLQEQDCLAYGARAESAPWLLHSGKEIARPIVKIRISCNQMTSLIRAALAGAGIALVPLYLCKSELSSGKLVRVLPNWASPGLPVSMVSPQSLAESARLKVVGEHLFIALQKALSS